MLQNLIASQLDKFKTDGGFAENLTSERLSAIKANSVKDNCPACPVCGRPMVKRMEKKGLNTGKMFWSCSDYPNCFGTRHCTDSSNI